MINDPSPPQRGRKWPARVALIVGLVVLAATFSHAMNAGSLRRVFGKTPADTHSRPIEATADSRDFRASGEAFVVCQGFVDTEFGVLSLAPSQAGRVVEVLVREPQEVKKGDALVRLDDRRATLTVRQAQAALDAAQAELSEARKAPERHQSKIAQQEAAIKAARWRLLSARFLKAKEEDRQEKPQIVSEVVEAAAEYDQGVKAQIRLEEERLKELELIDPASQVAQAEAAVAGKRALLDEARQGLEECTLRAPLGGTVLRVLAGPGDLVSPQPKQPAIILCPAGPRLVRAELDQEFAGGVKVGQPATIRDDSTEGQVWRGNVTRIADWYTQRRSVMQEPSQFNDTRTVECLIEFSPGQPVPRIGQRMRVFIRSKL